MRVAKFLGDDVTAHVAVVDPLHDHHNGTPARIIQAGRNDFGKPSESVLPLRLAFAINDIVGVVDDEPIAALASAKAANAGGKFESCAVIGKPHLRIFVVHEPKPRLP
jgi:hypothetical protein